MRRHLPRLLLLGALLSPMTLYALGLGEIRLNSALNQPFDADIELLAPSAEELASLKVGLAGPEMFARYGLDRPAFLAAFEVTVRRTREGGAAIKVTSNRSVTEPFVTLLVEVSWARGRLLREYTVLLDPPVFMPSEPGAAPPVTTPQAGTQSGRIERQPAPRTETPVPTPTPAPATQEDQPVATETSAPTVAGNYTVQRNDTLWRIASDVTPGSPRVVNRTMIAVFRANPEAFGGNINRLRSGSVLRIPDLAEIEAVQTADASAEVARQTAEWSGAQPTPSTEEASRLRLVTPEQTPTSPTAAAPTPAEPSSGQPAAGGTPPASTPDKRLEVTNPSLADVQQNVTPQPQTPVEPAPGTELPPDTTEATPAPEEPARPAPAQRPKRVVEEAPAPSLVDRIGEFWWVAVVLGLLVVVGFALAFIRRRREEADGASDSLPPLDFEPRAARAAAAPRGRAESFLSDSEETDAVAAAEPPITARRPESTAPRTRPVEAAVAEHRISEDTLSSETAVRVDQQDALAEADFHMAYGLYDQAADLVKIAIEREPGRRDLKLKLLEIYFVWGNKDLFLDTARDLNATRAQAAPGEWDKAVIMGKQIAPDDPLFKGEAGAAHVDLVDVNLEGGENRIDVDLFAEPEADQPAGLDLEFTSGEHRQPSQAASDLDFLLDEPKRGSAEGREIDPLARTQETPTIESPQLNRGSQTVRERPVIPKSATEQTAELSLDDLGLDVDSFEHTGSLEDTTSLEKDSVDDDMQPLRDDEMTQLAPSLGSFDRTMEAPRSPRFDSEATGTIYIDQVDLSGGGDTVEQPRPDVDSTASMRRPPDLSQELDVDLDHLSDDQPVSHDTLRQPRRDHDDDRFSSDVFAERTSEVPRIDLDVGEPLGADDHEPTQRQPGGDEMELSELEPVTMSEVGTKLDLARAYMDMGDPDGARSILEEVLSEGTPSQKQEAQRLIESIR